MAVWSLFLKGLTNQNSLSYFWWWLRTSIVMKGLMICFFSPLFSVCLFVLQTLFVVLSNFSLNPNYNLVSLISLATGLTYMPLICKSCESFQCDFSRCLEELFSSHPRASHSFFLQIIFMLNSVPYWKASLFQWSILYLICKYIYLFSVT